MDIDQSYNQMHCQMDGKIDNSMDTFPDHQINVKRKNLRNRLRDGIYSPPSVIDDLYALSCDRWKYKNGYEEYDIMMMMHGTDTYFKCNCGNGNRDNISTNYCKHIVGVILKMGLNQIKHMGMVETTQNVIDMLQNFNL